MTLRKLDSRRCSPLCPEHLPLRVIRIRGRVNDSKLWNVARVVLFEEIPRRIIQHKFDQ